MNLDQSESRLSGNNLWNTAVNLVSNANAAKKRDDDEDAQDEDEDVDVAVPVKAANGSSLPKTEAVQASA